MYSSEADFDSQFQTAYEEKSPKLNAAINIAIVGKVSTGKSSLLNAVLQREPNDPLAKVGAESGVTTSVTFYRLDEHVLIVDCPGLSDVRAENSTATQNFMSDIDLGIFVVTGSVDITQKDNFDDLRRNSRHQIVVLNKIDEWDDLEESAFDAVVSQWRQALGVEKIYGACTKGYDPKRRKNLPADLRGIDDIRTEIFRFLNSEGKDVLLARHLQNKEKYAIGIIAAAMTAVAGEAFIPGSAVYITATQVASIASLHYLYTGKQLSKSAALALVPSFAGQSIGMNIFLWAKSVLPPTGVIDAAAAAIAIVITFSMLAAVKWVLEKGYSLDQTDLLMRAFNDYKSAGEAFKKVSMSDFKNKEALINMLGRIISTR